jgi:hypothetical protein
MTPDTGTAPPSPPQPATQVKQKANAVAAFSNFDMGKKLEVKRQTWIDMFIAYQKKRRLDAGAGSRS